MLKAPQLTWTEAYLPQKRNSMHFVNIHAELAAELRLVLMKKHFFLCPLLMLKMKVPVVTLDGPADTCSVCAH